MNLSTHPAPIVQSQVEFLSAKVGARALAWIDLYLAKARPRLTDDPARTLLFLTIKSRPVHPNELSAKVRQYMDQARITKKGSCHLFRHSTATLMLEGGAEIRYIQALLGHVSLSATQIYTHVSIGKLCQVHQQTHPAQLPRHSGGGEDQPVAGPGQVPGSADSSARDDQADTPAAFFFPSCSAPDRGEPSPRGPAT